MNSVLLDGSLPFGPQVTSADTIYVIEDVFDLNGGTVTFNDNCILRFNGGLISNAILIGNNTRVENLTNAVIFDNVELRYPVSSTSLTGWLGECRDTWFAYSDSPEYRINPIDPAKNRAHFAIVKSVSPSGTSV